MTDGGAEELAQPDRRPLVRRLRLDLALGAAVLLVILLVTRHHHGSGAPASTPAPSTTPTATVPGSAVPHSLGTGTLAVYPVPNQHAGAFEDCPDGLPCEHFADVPLGIREALAAAFPAVRVLHAHTTRIDVKGYGTALWRSAVRARAGDELIRLRVQPRSPGDRQRQGTEVSAGRVITHWASVQNQLRVLIDVVAPAAAPPVLPAVEQLARDARLSSPW
jgi:hypothetical protein